MLLNILIVLVILLALLLLVIARRPATFRYTRSLLIAAPPEILSGYADDLHRFQDWNPWAAVDPSSVITYSGPPTGPGASYTWSGNRNVGEGTMTITESKPGQLVRARMEFRKPFTATNTVEFTFEPQGPGTLVSWIMYGPNNFMGKAMGLFINCDKMCGDQFNKGLASLKALAEKPAVNPAPRS